MVPKQIDHHDDFIFSKKYTFCTLVTRKDEYEEMLFSTMQAGFDSDDVEFIYFNNIDSNNFDGFNGLNKAISAANGKYLIFCHQDILFNFDKREKLDSCIAQIESFDPKWAVLGNAGKTRDGKIVLRISDPHGSDTSIGNFPEEVMSVDENFIVLNRTLNLSASHQMTGFHLYGLDICRNANYLGYKNYVIDFHLLHKSGGKIDETFSLAQQSYSRLEHHRKNQNFYTTTCTQFFVGNNRFLNMLLKVKFFFKAYKKIFRLK